MVIESLESKKVLELDAVCNGEQVKVFGNVLKMKEGSPGDLVNGQTSFGCQKLFQGSDVCGGRQNVVVKSKAKILHSGTGCGVYDDDDVRFFTVQFEIIFLHSCFYVNDTVG